MSSYNSFLIGIAGGTGAGKTMLANELYKRLGENMVTIIPQDAYYKDRGHLSLTERENINYDHPDAFENNLLAKQLQNLKNGKLIKRPVYNFKTHIRRKETITVHPSPIVIVEGIMVLENKNIRDLFDLKIFVEAEADIRLIRRFQRDIKERGRSLESVKEQYLKTVRPMYLKFVEPTKRYTDVVISGDERDKFAIETMAEEIKRLSKNAVKVSIGTGSHSNG